MSLTWKDITNVESEIVNATLRKYKELPQSGKPIVHEKKVEWTVISSIVMIHCLSKEDYTLQVISIGTGSKCLPFSKLVKTGDVLNDSHAEIITRRGFIKYLLDQYQVVVKSGTEQNNNPFEYKNNRLVLKDNYSFHMYISQSPCGDASTNALAQVQTPESLQIFESGSHKRAISEIEDSFLIENIYAYKKQKNTFSKQFQRGRVKFDQIGILRTKPGRVDSESTLCMSCSDKIARWNVLGLQSALLSQLYDPIYLSSIIIGDMFDKEALERALYERMLTVGDKIEKPYKLNHPYITSTEIPFESSKTRLESNYFGKKTIVSSSTSLSWVIDSLKPEVFVNGKKQGAPKGKPTNSKTRPSTSKKSLLDHYRKVTSSNNEMTYRTLKLKSINYQKAKTCLLDHVFDAWVQTPLEYEDFH